MNLASAAAMIRIRLLLWHMRRSNAHADRVESLIDGDPIVRRSDVLAALVTAAFVAAAVAIRHT
ncbi:hypothetical protein [Hansschlegelia beijingensis]|uniref:Uncharacterized protein n=1 Tax=Hansschlegelia beijingensis TaxID=1133344 RepID=A0A7W6CYA3_9HYPH|nr:hypothetical protein [Hansschlegelia beijingensis]MBB3972502.1 hypothetical protein [Hansschlegelia beijingensis]